MSLTKVTYSMIEGAQYNVLDYGAVGDGVNDDGPAIQAAVDAAFAAGGGTVYAPSGTYLLASYTSLPYYTVKAKSNVNVIGDGASTIFKVADGLVTPAEGVTFLYNHTEQVSNVRYSNFKVDWNGPNNPNFNTSGSNTCRLGGAGGITNWHIDNVWFLNPGGHHNIFIGGGGENNSVTNCLFQNAGRAVTNNNVITDHSTIYTNCNNVIVSNNIIICDNLNDTVATAIELHGNQIICNDNSIYGYAIGIIAGATENTGNNFHYNISNNIINQVIDGIRLVAANTHWNDFYLVESNEVLCRPVASRNCSGIAMQNTSSVASGEIKIQNNLVFLSSCPDLTRTHVGINASDWTTVSLADNNITNWSAEGVYYENTISVSNIFDLSNNQITGCGYTSTAASKRSVAINSGVGGMNNVFLYENSIQTATAYGGTVAVNGVTFNANVYQNIEIINNNIAAQSASSIVKLAVEANKICLIKHYSNENPTDAAIKATMGSQWSSLSTSRIWNAVNLSQNGTSDVWQSIEYAAAAPVAGTYYRGDRVINVAPAVGSPKAWSCTVSGTPGTWVSEGNL
jgi:hypothetical protein